MVERVKITVRPSGAHPDVLTVQDAMKQVLDIFDMLTAREGDGSGIEWQLTRASTNSPFHVESEAVSFAPNVDVSVVARAQKAILAEDLRALARGERPSDPDFPIAAARQMLLRNLNGIGETEVDLGIGAPITITRQAAYDSVEAIDKGASGTIYDLPSAREEHGAIEGTLLHVGHHWGHPAIKVRDSVHGRAVWCRLTQALQSTFESKATFRDIWQHSRVRVRGKIRYTSNRTIEYVNATDVQKIAERVIPLSALHDGNFSGGLSVADYLDKFRDGSFGR